MGRCGCGEISQWGDITTYISRNESRRYECMGDASDLIKQFCAQLCHPIASIARASMPPAKKKSKSTGKQSSLAGAGVFPMLSKTSVAIGLFCLVPGAFCGYQLQPIARSSCHLPRPSLSATWQNSARAVRWTSVQGVPRIGMYS